MSNDLDDVKKIIEFIETREFEGAHLMMARQALGGLDPGTFDRFFSRASVGALLDCALQLCREAHGATWTVQELERLARTAATLHEDGHAQALDRLPRALILACLHEQHRKLAEAA